MANYFDIYPMNSSESHTIESERESVADFVESLGDKRFLVGRFTVWSGRKLPQSGEYALAVATISRIAKGR